MRTPGRWLALLALAWLAAACDDRPRPPGAPVPKADAPWAAPARG